MGDDRALPGLPQFAGRFSDHFRRRRWAQLVRLFPDLPNMRVIDLGGYYWNWVNAPIQPKSVVVVNLDDRRFDDQPPWVETITADACDLPPALFDRDFDLVYSNSLLEHVGGYWRRQRMAEGVRRLAGHHWVQTPARSFPVEPHFLCPGFQFLPVSARTQLSRSWPLSPDRRKPSGHLESVLQIELVSATEMRHLFPGSRLYCERLAGLTKSFAAVL